LRDLKNEADNSTGDNPIGNDPKADNPRDESTERFDPKDPFGSLLRARRFPNLTKLRIQRRKFFKALALPPGAKLSLDQNFEDDKARLTVDFNAPNELFERLSAAGLALNDPAFLALWDLTWPEE
jgi:hypothetical protein